MTTPTGSLPIRDVVRIKTGERITPAYIERRNYAIRWYLAASLKKDGTPKQIGREPGGWGIIISERFSIYAYYDAAREAKADPIRNIISALRTQLDLAERELSALYEEQT